MKLLLLSVACAFLLLPGAARGDTHIVHPDDPPSSLYVLWMTSGPEDTLLLMPGTYDLGNGWWPLPLTSESPSMIGSGGPEGVVLQGTGGEMAFLLEQFVYDAHMDFERLTFSGLAEIIGRVDPAGSSRGELHFTDNIVENCGTESWSSGFTTTACWGMIARNVFRNNHGCAIGTYHTTAPIEDNEMYGNDGGVWDICCTSPPTRRNHIHDNSGTAIRTGYDQGGTLEYNVIERNGGAGISIGRTGTVRHNVIRENAIGVVSVASMASSSAAIHYNDICDNVQFSLYVTTHPSQTWDCTQNWWGSTDPATISQGIWDCYDDPEVGACVVFEPFCEVPGCEFSGAEPATWASIKAMFRAGGGREPN